MLGNQCHTETKTPTKLWKVKVFTSSHSTNYHPVIDACLNSKRSPFQGTSVIYSEQISFRTGQIFRPEELENVAPLFCGQPRSPQQHVPFFGATWHVTLLQLQTSKKAYREDECPH